MILETILDYLKNNPKQARVIKNVGVILLLLLLFSILANIQTSRPFVLQKTPLNASTFATLQGDDLRYFNGLVFLKTNTTTQKTTVISKGLRLPTIESLYFLGDNGALAVFSGNFYATPLESYIDNLHLNDIDSQTLSGILWYINFGNGSVQPVATHAPDRDAFYYNPSSKVAYYIAPELAGEETGEENPIVSKAQRVLYTIANPSESPQAVAALPTAGEAGRYIQPCTSHTLCVITSGVDTKHQLYTLDDNKFKKLLETNGFILPTGSTDMFVKAVITPGEARQIDDLSMTNDSTQFISYDISTSKERVLDAPQKGVVGVFALAQNKAVSIIGNINSLSRITIHDASTFIGLSKTTLSTDTASQTILPNNHVLSSPYSVSYDLDAKQMLSLDNNESYIYAGQHSIPTKNQTSPSSIVETCVKRYNGSSTYTEKAALYTLYIPYSDTFSSTTAGVADCLFKEPSNSYGYIFDIKGIDPVTGKIATS
jgi:hypothetical protein